MAEEIKEAIEELIEETYLMGLTEREIQRDLDRFVESCSRVIRAHVKDKETMSALAEKLALARTCTLIADRSDIEDGQETLSEGRPRSDHERFAERAARNKRLILKAIGECDPKLVRLIEKTRYQTDGKDLPPPKLKWKGGNRRTKLLILKGCYIATLILIALLIYLVMLQR